MISIRKTKILKLVIESYIETGEPVGSCTVSKKCELGISPATIRNEMSDLEDMGYITQPHISAGRIPSDKGYRHYVDNLVKQKQLTDYEIKFIKKMISNNIDQIDYLLEKTAQAISFLTNYTTIITEPVVEHMKIKLVKLIPVDVDALVFVVVTNDNKAKNFTIKSTIPDDLPAFNFALNKNLSDIELCDVNSDLLHKILCEINYKNQDLLNKLFDAVHSIDDIKIYTSGMKNIFAFPEFHDLQKAKDIFGIFEQHGLLSSLFSNHIQNDIEITIGNENKIDLLKSCSLVKTNFTIGNDTSTRIGIVGPTRMNYSRVISVLSTIESLIAGLYDY